jgi:hypothetical protein
MNGEDTAIYLDCTTGHWGYEAGLVYISVSAEELETIEDMNDRDLKTLALRLIDRRKSFSYYQYKPVSSAAKIAFLRGEDEEEVLKRIDLNEEAHKREENINGGS